jgi:hypothetical protein
MGPADEVTSHLYSFGIRGKQFQYVEGKLPEGTKFHGRMTDHDVLNLQERGAQVLVLEPHYTSQDLKDARAQCTGMSGNSPDQASDPKTKSRPDSETQPATVSTPAAAVAQASVAVDSIPPGADIEIDGAFVGDTPSTITVAPGSHQIAIKKKGFTNWNKTLNVTGGTIRLNPELEQEPPRQ